MPTLQEYQQKQRDLIRLQDKIKDAGDDAPAELLERERAVQEEVSRISRTHRSGLYLPDAN